jgi:hypothetical protein
MFKIAVEHKDQAQQEVGVLAVSKMMNSSSE